MPDGETQSSVVDPPPSRDLRLEDGRLLRAVRFGPVVILSGTFALTKTGCRGLEITAPGSAAVRWRAKSGGRFEIGSISPREADVLRHWIFPDAVVLVLIDAADWPEDATDIAIKAYDGAEQELFTGSVPLEAQDLLLGVPVGLTLAVARRPEAPEPRLAFGDMQAPLTLRAAAEGGLRFEIWDAALPGQVYDGVKHRIDLRSAEGTRISKRTWTAPEMFQLPKIAPHIAERPRLDAIPPGDVTLALDHLALGWQRASLSDDQRARSVAALLQRRTGAGGDVALFLFAPTLEDALATPAIAQLAEAHGPDLVPHIVLPTKEAIAFCSAIQGQDRVDQMVPLLTPDQVLGRIRAQPPGAAVVLLPAGTGLEPEAQKLIADVRQSKSIGRLARAARQIALGPEARLRIAEQPDMALQPASPLGPQGGPQRGPQGPARTPEIGPGRPGDMAAIVSQRAALRLLAQREGLYGGLALPMLELAGPQEAPFTFQALDSAFVSVPGMAACLVVQGLPDAATEHGCAERLALAMAGMAAKGLRVLHICQRGAYKALPGDSPLRQPWIGVEAVQAVTQRELEAIWRIGVDALTPECKATIFLTAEQMLSLAAALDAERLAQALRLAGAATEGAADLIFDIAGGPEVRGLCTARRARLCP